ncbi:MAG: argininosuccinate lyase [Ruminococcus sp.]|nr:argininosuccinate lyase [Ruminococcus sp.]
MADKMWAGRFSKEVDETVNAFNSSIAFDGRMYRHDIQGSIAHAKMLGKCGIITENDSMQIIDGLKEILADLESGELEFDMTAEDIHMFIEAELTKRLGSVGKRLHTSRSRNDQVALDVRLYLRDEIEEIKALVLKLCKVLCEMAKKHTETVMPGYTHLQRAQPVTFAHHLMAYVQMLLRDYTRLEDTAKRMNECPLGSCALAGTTYKIDRHMTSKDLGFDRPMENSLDGVSDRDSCVELACAISLIMTHLSRFSEEVIMWCSWEFKFIELDDAYATGSSIMPQKKNPDVTELIRGKTGRVNGNLMTLLSMLKGLPLAYNKDMQEDKEAIFDSVDNVKLCLKTFIPMTETMKVNADRMRAAAAGGFINATDCADYLVKHGMPFRDAYKITGTLVAECIDRNLTLETLPIEDYKKLSDLFGDDIYDAISLETCVRERKSFGGPAPDCVKQQIETAESRIKELEK